MTDRNESSIGLSELIEQVKRELLTTNEPTHSTDVPLLSVDSIELELRIAVKREGKGGINVDVLSFGGFDLEGGISRDDVHTVKVKLSPLLDKDQLLKVYQKLNPDKVSLTIKRNLDAHVKGSEDQGPDAGVV